MIRFALISSMLAVVACGSSSGGTDFETGTDSGSGDDQADAASTADSGHVGDLDSGVGGDSASMGSGDSGHDASLDAGLADASLDSAIDSAPTDVIGPYGSAGPYTVTTATFTVPAPNGSFTTTAYIPSATGPDPVVILSSGLEQKGLGYAPYAERLASWGVVTFLRDDPGVFGEGTSDIAEDVAYMVTTWLAATNASSTSALAGKLDTSNVGLAGHSRGGQVALLAGEGGAHGLIHGVFGLDPVDNAGDGGLGVAAAGIASIGVPIAFIGETTDSASTGCAPSTENYQVLYAAASSPAVAITAVNADHTMFEDASNCTLCELCTAGTASQTLVLDTAVRYLTAFFARQLLGDTSVGAAFTGAGADQDVAAGTITIVSK